MAILVIKSQEIVHTLCWFSLWKTKSVEKSYGPLLMSSYCLVFVNQFSHFSGELNGVETVTLGHFWSTDSSARSVESDSCCWSRFVQSWRCPPSPSPPPRPPLPPTAPVPAPPAHVLLVLISLILPLFLLLLLLLLLPFLLLQHMYVYIYTYIQKIQIK